ncbi:MAG: sulfatase [Planctomycetes bacterium]|nr:sulfatase [Planctomycetota bacterium]
MLRDYRTRRDFLKAVGVGALAAALPGVARAVDSGGRRPPNFIVIFCDDLGYGDIGCFGSKKHRTPNIDRMAAEGMRFTSFYVTSGVCSPSRSSLMTGCYPRRVNMHQDHNNLCVLFPRGKKGLNPSEITIAEVLKQKDYATACVGKWHLGDQPEFLPTRQGFDYYYGIPYSNDMGGKKGGKRPPLPLMRNETVIEAPANQRTLTKRYTGEVVKFITANKDKPFFVYLPHTMPHMPIFSSGDFAGKSANGKFGDAVEEIDWSTGRILETLKQLGIDKNTLVVFTSDNGAARGPGGSNLPLSGWKGSTMEGGMREPCVMRWPGKIPAQTSCDELAITMDLLPTFAKLARTKAPADRIIDGRDIGALMFGAKNAETPHEAFYYYQMDQLQAVRSGKWKLYPPLKPRKRNWGKPIGDTGLELYDLKADIAEKNNVADKHPNVVKRILALVEKARVDLGDTARPGANQRPAGMVVTPKPLTMKTD